MLEYEIATSSRQKLIYIIVIHYYNVYRFLFTWMYFVYRTYRLSINLLIFLLQQPQHTRALDRQAVWSELSHTLHFFTALVPELYPPIIVGVEIAEATLLHQMYACTTCQATHGRKLHHFQLLGWTLQWQRLMRALSLCLGVTLMGRQLSQPWIPVLLQ